VQAQNELALIEPERLAEIEERWQRLQIEQEEEEEEENQWRFIDRATDIKH
jgi:hypothetical protein